MARFREDQPDDFKSLDPLKKKLHYIYNGLGVKPLIYKGNPGFIRKIYSVIKNIACGCAIGYALLIEHPLTEVTINASLIIL